MKLISIEGYENANIICLKNKTGDLWVIIKYVKDGLGVKNMYDLVLKEIYGVYGKEDLTKEEIKCYKMTKREFFKTFYDYDEDSLNTKSNKTIFVKNTIMTNIIKNFKGEKKRGARSADEFRKKLFIPDHEIYESIEHKVKSKIGKTFVNEEILEEHSVKIYEIDLYFNEHYEKKIQVNNNNGKKYILFRIDLHFTKYCLALKIDEKGHTDRDPIFEQKRHDSLEKKLNCTFITFNTNRENFDVDYEVSKIQTFISQFKVNKIKEKDNKKRKEKDNKNRELEDKNKELEDKI